LVANFLFLLAGTAFLHLTFWHLAPPPTKIGERGTSLLLPPSADDSSDATERQSCSGGLQQLAPRCVPSQDRRAISRPATTIESGQSQQPPDCDGDSLDAMENQSTAAADEDSQRSSTSLKTFTFRRQGTAADQPECDISYLR